MSDKETPKTSQNLIADAIRAKRDGRGSKPVLDEIEAMEAELLADLERFDPDLMARMMNDQFPSSSSAKSREAQFPSIDPAKVIPDRSVPASPPPGQPVAAARPQTVAAAPTTPAPSILDQLRKETEFRQTQLNAAQQQASAIEITVDRALRRVFSYLNELVQQLNFLHREVPRAYQLTPSHTLDGLQWEEGFADFRTRADSTSGLYEHVSLNYRLSGKQPLVIERDGLIAETFRKTLFDHGLEFTLDEIRNERRSVEFARFSIAPRVKINVRWEAHPERGSLRLITRNLERLGHASYELPADAVDNALLDEFALLLLGQPNTFSRQYAC